MVEIWKDIKGFEGKYQVSNLGRVKSLDYNHTKKEKILKPGFNGHYYFVQFCIKGRRGVTKNFFVHRLVASAFLENPDNLPCVNHRDENKQNNCVSNLEFCTHQYNSTYNNVHIKKGKKKAKKVGCYKDGELIKVYDSIRSVKIDGFLPSKVILCCQGNRKSHSGYQWRYE